jgi:hypothetical protein
LLVDTTFLEIDLRSIADLLDDTIEYRALHIIWYKPTSSQSMGWTNEDYHPERRRRRRRDRGMQGSPEVARSGKVGLLEIALTTCWLDMVAAIRETQEREDVDQSFLFRLFLFSILASPAGKALCSTGLSELNLRRSNSQLPRPKCDRSTPTANVT